MLTITINKCSNPQWENMHNEIPPLTNEAHIWRIKITPAFTPLLTPEEAQKMERFNTPHLKNQFATARGALRYLSGKYTNQSPANMVFHVAHNKKPYCQQTDTLQFNITHSGEYVLIAFANEEIGIDLEQINTMFNYPEVLQRCFSEHEIEQIQNAPDPRKFFYLYWTRKEALLKATGHGVNDQLPRIPCSNGTYEIANDLIESLKNWRINSFEADDQHMASVAHDPMISTIHFFDLPVA